MATYYVNLSLGTNGHAGTNTDPFSFYDWQTGPWNASHIYYIKGSGSFAGSSGTIGTIRNWNLSVDAFGINAPFRARFLSGPSFGASYIEGGIFDFNNNIAGGFANQTFLNCYFTNSSSFGFSNSTLKGCTINVASISNGPAANTWTDCIISCPGSIGGHPAQSVTLNNCVTTFALPGSWTANNSQLSWTPPTFPLWDDSQSVFYSFYETMKTGGTNQVNTPPQPGNSPYTGYETGLWRETRSSIGAVSFTAPIPKSKITIRFVNN